MRNKLRRPLAFLLSAVMIVTRSEERRVGKEC